MDHASGEEADRHSSEPKTDEAKVTDAQAELGNTAEVETSVELSDERALRDERNRPDLPDRAFDRITPQV